MIDNNHYFRIYASVIGVLALMRYIIVHIFNPAKYKSYRTDIDELSAIEKVIKALELPFPAMKIGFNSLIYKCQNRAVRLLFLFIFLTLFNFFFF